MKLNLKSVLFCGVVLVGCTSASATDPLTPVGPPENVPASLDEIENCTDPVVMVVFGELSEEAFKWKHPSGRNYAKELRSSRLYERFGGHYMYSSTKPLETFENPYPEGRFLIMAEWPCLEAAQGFYYSPEYQEMIPLREGSGEFQFTVYPKKSIEDMYYMKGE